MPQKPFTPEEALLALQQGGEEGLEFFFQHYYTPLTYFAGNLLEDGCLAEEIVSEAFVKLWHHREKLSSPAHLKHWLYQAVRNTCIDHQRLEKTARSRKQHYEALQPANEASFLQHVVETETYQQVFEALENLPPGLAKVVQLYYFEKKTVREISAETGTHISSVKKQKKKALQLLKQQLPPLCLLLTMLFKHVLATAILLYTLVSN